MSSTFNFGMRLKEHFIFQSLGLQILLDIKLLTKARKKGLFLA
jgi:hypothetical protein